jgi:hypothetical protein
LPYDVCSVGRIRVFPHSQAARLSENSTRANNRAKSIAETPATKIRSGLRRFGRSRSDFGPAQSPAASGSFQVFPIAGRERLIFDRDTPIWERERDQIYRDNSIRKRVDVILERGRGRKLIGGAIKSIAVPIILIGSAIISGDAPTKLIGLAINSPELAINSGVVLINSIDRAIKSVAVAITSVSVDQS